ncbi:hypothetical protein [Novosphingobium sp. KACC 22771]|uniref:hypothetical protein n=1 Tax=Novosphingobium sp. KACC 22771 TaxID=3025670 RepID=UPI002365B778|nr:hypothetical protein [Novosphingobium sp. KACC 22771]WDF72653.1 hypothetical protein PQ467_01015 [Novosphingobium sp. KACC 22771]
MSRNAMSNQAVMEQSHHRRAEIARPWFDHTSAMALHSSFETLRAGCLYLIGREGRKNAASGPEKVMLRVSGNHLKELDRFFSLLIGEYRAFLRAMAPHAGRAPADLHPLDKHRPRLRAIRRLQVAACDGPVRNHCAVTARDLAVASLGLAGGKQAAGRPFVLDDAVLAEVGRFYLALAADVVGLA